MKHFSLEEYLVRKGLCKSEADANSYIVLGFVKVNNNLVLKPDYQVGEDEAIRLTANFVSRGALKLASVKDKLELDFRDKLIVDVGSSTGGFTDYALQNSAKRVIAIDLGKNQLHEKLKNNPKIEIHDHTSIFDINNLPDDVAMVLIDVNFVSLREVLLHIYKLINRQTEIIALLKPQFEISGGKLKNEGIIKNNRMRRDIIKDFENWVKQRFVILDKADSKLAGRHGNLERFYKLRKA
ncbi:MAG TPA: SAM-dependent methyltransferase [Candidatus Saccharimonadales bacterium]|nr:SAM-dependent methyltransferase [Candidatus Saccharimonadales bacterium]